MKVGILGAGISGLSIARFLRKTFDIEILESKGEVGGIARTRSVNGYTYHPVGGHCFNSKHTEVLDFVFGDVLPQENWNCIERNAAIKFCDRQLSYPIEYSVREIAESNPELASAIITDFMSERSIKIPDNLEDWFRNRFGDILSEMYFLPYNKKIWNMEPSEIDPRWVQGKLPIPDKESFLRSLNGQELDQMTHQKFYYPATNNQNTFIDSLASSLEITLNYTVSSINFNSVKNVWMVNDEKEFDILISTLPLNLLPEMVAETPSEIREAAKKLRYNRITTMLWTSEATSRTWTYIPDENSIFHRYIHIGNYYIPKQHLTITESIGERTYQEMKIAGEKDSFLLTPLDYNVSDHAYVVFDKEYKETTKLIKDHFSKQGIYLLGRFGEWDYFNMDECIKRSMDLSGEIKKKFHE